MRKQMFVAGIFDMILAVLLSIGAVLFAKDILSIDFASGISAISLSPINIILVSIVTILIVLLFVNGIMNMTTAIEMGATTKKDVALMGTANLVLNLGVLAFLVYVALQYNLFTSEVGLSILAYFILSALAILSMTIVVIVIFAKLPKKPKVKKVKTIKTKPAKIKIEKKQVVKAEEPKKDEVKENVVQPNFNFRKRK